MNQDYYAFLIVFFVPVGIYYFLRRGISLFANNFYIPGSNADFEKLFEKKYNLAYEKNKAEEVLKVEEDAMYVRLEMLSKPNVKAEVKKNHILAVTQWASKNKYPGNKKQVDLLLRALKSNQRNIDLTEKISKHLAQVSASMPQSGSKKDKNVHKKTFGIKFTTITPRTISRAVTIAICLPFSLFTGVLDSLPNVLQYVFIIFLFLVLLNTLVITLGLHFSVQIFFAFLLTFSFSYLYSTWLHVWSEPQTVNLSEIETEISYPLWLTADDLKSDNKDCGKRIIFTDKGSSDEITLKFKGNYVSLFDDTCNPISSDYKITLSPGTSTIIYLKPFNKRSLFLNSNFFINIIWDNPATQQVENESIEIFLENLMWSEFRSWYLFAGGGVLVILLGFLGDKFKEGLLSYLS
jgi:hypothetical protein